MRPQERSRLFEFAYFETSQTSLLGCSLHVDTLFYFTCNEQYSNAVLLFLLNLPVLFLYAGTSAILGVPSGGSFVGLFYALDAIFVLALVRLLYLLYAGARGLGRRVPQ